VIILKAYLPLPLLLCAPAAAVSSSGGGAAFAAADDELPPATHKRKHLKQQPQVRQSEKSFSLCFANTDRPKGVQKDGCLVPHKHTHTSTLWFCVWYLAKG